MVGTVSKIEAQYRRGLITRNELRTQRWRITQRARRLNGGIRVSLVKRASRFGDSK